MDANIIVGTLGVAILLLAFLLNLLKIVSVDSKTYVLLNIIGAGMSCYASFLINYIPFVVLEATWMIVGVVALIKVLQ
jgi:hypothetical protein